jgi:voltage-gated potassium channel Kch
VLARAFDRGHLIELIRAGADEAMRETFESALALGGTALATLGEAPEVVETVLDEVRKRDADRLALQLSEGSLAGRDLLLANKPTLTAAQARAAAAPPATAPGASAAS